MARLYLLAAIFLPLNFGILGIVTAALTGSIVLGVVVQLAWWGVWWMLEGNR